ncbi:MAG: gephyrin-like molybdotransferase receptor GlpR [Nakamurella sp.]
MTVPQSLLVVALAVAWLIVLVPSSSRRRGHVKETVQGSGFRVLSRTPAALRRPARRIGNLSTAITQDPRRNVRSEDQMASQQVDADNSRAEDDTVVLDAVPTRGSHPYDDDRDGPDRAERADSTHEAVHADQDADAVAREEAAADDEHDEAELRRQYQAWRTSTRDEESAESDATAGPDAGAEPTDVRPIPRRPGRGTYDPAAAERARAYKFARRRRAVLVLTLLIVGFAIAAVLVSSSLWIGAGVSAVLLALFLAYLRRQVKIESDIRHRRLAKLERARQIRPEHAPDQDVSADPYAQRTSTPYPASGPVRHRSNRVVLELDDDDPGFDDLEQYEPMEYRRAVGQ